MRAAQAPGRAARHREEAARGPPGSEELRVSSRPGLEPPARGSRSFPRSGHRASRPQVTPAARASQARRGAPPQAPSARRPFAGHEAHAAAPAQVPPEATSRRWSEAMEGDLGTLPALPRGTGSGSSAYRSRGGTV